jgi:hypothetical protein
LKLNIERSECQERLRGLIVLDEVQRRPDLFPLLRVLADRRPVPSRFLLLGSASPWLARGVSESLAGRVTFVDMGGFSLDEVGVREWRRLWFRGPSPTRSGHAPRARPQDGGKRSAKPILS